MIPTEAELGRESILAERYNVTRVRCLSRHAEPHAETCPHCAGALSVDPRSGMTHWCPACSWWAGRPWSRKAMECQSCGDQFVGLTFDPEATTGWCRACVDRFDTNVRRKYNYRPRPETKPSRPTESEVPF